MLDLNELSPGELSTLSEQAGSECSRRFSEIAQASDPGDRPLQALLGRLAEVARTELESESDRTEVPSASEAHPPERSTLREFIRSSLRSLSRGFGEGWLHRDIALFFAECLEEEVSRFYLMLSEHAGESRLRHRLSHLAERERRKLHYLRQLVL